jgi:hypothetical protein
MASATSDEGQASGSEKRWLRRLYWGAFVIGPAGTALAFLDVAAHMENGPMIGLEGNGAPNALPYLFAALAFACVTGAIFARTVLDPKPSFMRGILLGFVMFIVTGFASGPIFRWKWRHDCEHGVARACFAISQLALDQGEKTRLGERACDLGDPRACPSADPSASAAAPAPSP